MTQQGYKRKLTAILSADVEGYSRLMGEDEDATIKTLTTYRELMTTLINKHRGRVVDSPGDNLLAEFSSVVDAVRCAVEIQEELRIRNAELPENKRMQFRIGINLGDVVEEGERIYGDGINIAARVEGLAEGGGICISGTVYDSIKNKLSLSYESLGEHTVKNITEPVRVYRMRVGPEAVVHPKPKPWRKAALAALVVLIVAAGAFTIWNFYFRPPPIEPASEEKMAYPLPDKPSIAVLAFDNLSGDPSQEYFSDGITEEIITALSKVPYLLVIARNSTFSYKGKPVKISQVAEELGVRYVLEGSVRKAGEKLRVTAQLIDAIKGHHLWAELYDREMKDIFALQDEITMKILSALELKLTEGEQATTRRKGTDNLEAYLKTVQALEGRDLLNKEGNLLARRRAEEAMALDPEYARPYRILAITHVGDIVYGTSKSPRRSIERALEMAQKAISLDDSDPCGYEVLSAIYLMKRQHDRAIAEAKRAINLDPNGADAYFRLGCALIYAGRAEEAIVPLEKAIRINPIAPTEYPLYLGRAYRDTERYEEAITELRKAIDRSPDSPFPHFHLAAAYSLADRVEDARAEVEKLLGINPKASIEDIKRGPYKNQTDRDRIIDAMRKAGLPGTPPLPLPDKPSIAVLPFTNMSEDPKQEYFSDGITEEIITALSKTSKLFVIARTSSFKYKGKEIDMRTVGRELGVHYALEGSVRKAGDTVRITAQLIDATTGNHVWAQRYDRDLKDIFALQDEITMKIITALQVKLTEGEQVRLWGKKVENLDVYLKLLEARSLWAEGTKESHIRFGQIAQELINMAPEFAGGYRMLAWHHWWLARVGKSPREAMTKAFQLAQKALHMDESDSSSHALVGQIYVLMRKYEEAIAAGERSVELDPNGAMARGLLGMTLSYADRPDEAISHLTHGIRLNPFAPYWYFYRLGRCYMQKGEYEKALKEYKKALQRAPNSFSIHSHLAALYVLLDRQEEARAAANKVLELFPNFSVERITKTSPYKNQAFLKLVADALRKAGLK